MKILNKLSYIIALTYPIIMVVGIFYLQVFVNSKTLLLNANLIILIWLLIACLLLNKNIVFSVSVLLISSLNIYEMIIHFERNFIYNSFSYNYLLHEILITIGFKKSIVNNLIFYFTLNILFQLAMFYESICACIRILSTSKRHS